MIENKKYELVSVKDEMPEKEGKYVVQTSSSLSTLIRFPLIIRFVETTMHINKNQTTGKEERIFDLHRQIPIAWLKEIQ